MCAYTHTRAPTYTHNERESSCVFVMHAQVAQGDRLGGFCFNVIIIIIIIKKLSIQVAQADADGSGEIDLFNKYIFVY